MIKFNMNSFKYMIAILAVVFFGGCRVEDKVSHNQVDDGSTQFVSATVVDDINASVMLQYVKAVIDPLATNAFGYKAVKISYNTVNEDNTPVVASGLLVIPTATDAYQQYRALQGQPPFSVSMLCDNHETIFTNSEAPTAIEVGDHQPNSVLAIFESAYAGFAGIYPDYIGFGDSNATVHPYIMKKASARASLDMIKASMKYMQDNGVVLNHQLYITGYSEGGYVSMALGQKVEDELDNVNLKGVAPMAAPYNVKDLADVELNATRTMVYPGLLADLAYAYSVYYNENLNEIANPNISIGQFELAFSGVYGAVEIHTILGLADPENGDYGLYTHRVDELFSTNFLTDYRNNRNNPMKRYFEENSVDDWVPSTKVNLIQCIDDEIIPFSQSENLYNKLKANGADVTLTGIPTDRLIQQKDATHPFVHANCGTTAYGAAVQWFAAIRNGDI